jgi:hypothetical protein
MGKEHYILLAIAVLLFFTAFAGCLSEELGDNIVNEEYSGEYNTNQNTTLKVTNINGNVDIITYEGNTVKLEVEERVSEKEKEQLKETNVTVTEENNEIVIKTVRDDPDDNQVTVIMDIKVPKYLIVESVATSNGDVTVKDVNGYPSVSSSNGNVVVEGTNGISQVETSNGKVTAEIHGFTEDISISSSNGNVMVSILPSLNATISMQTSNGDVSITALTLDDLVDSGKQASGKLNGGGHSISISTSNGNVDLKKLEI